MPRAFRDSSGTVWVVYFSNPYVTSRVWSSGWSVQFLLSDDEGETWSGPKTIVTFEGVPIGLSITEDHLGRIWVVWDSPKSPGGGDNEVWYSISEDGGNTWSSPTTPYVPPAPWNGYTYPSIVEAFGKIWIFFRHWLGYGSREGILYFASEDGGSSWTSRTVIVDGPNSEDVPYAYLDSEGKLWLLWARDYSWAGPRDIWYKTTLDGIAWSPEVQITDSPSIDDNSPSIMEDSLGNMYVFLERYEDGQYDIWYSTLPKGGSEWTDLVQITEDPNEDRYPTGTLVKGNIWAFWESNRTGSSDIWYAIIASEQVMTPPYTYGDTNGFESTPDNEFAKGVWITKVNPPKGNGSAYASIEIKHVWARTDVVWAAFSLGDDWVAPVTGTYEVTFIWRYVGTAKTPRWRGVVNPPKQMEMSVWWFSVDASMEFGYAENKSNIWKKSWREGLGTFRFEGTQISILEVHADEGVTYRWNSGIRALVRLHVVSAPLPASETYNATINAEASLDKVIIKYIDDSTSSLSVISMFKENDNPVTKAKMTDLIGEKNENDHLYFRSLRVAVSTNGYTICEDVPNSFEHVSCVIYPKSKLLNKK